MNKKTQNWYNEKENMATLKEVKNAGHLMIGNALLGINKNGTEQYLGWIISVDKDLKFVELGVVKHYAIPTEETVKLSDECKFWYIHH